MTLRRWLLVMGLGAMIASAAHPAIGAPVDVEAGGYGGSASGGWACGPDARVKYGGGGGQVTVRTESTKEEPEHGFAATVGGAIEDRSFSYLDCGGQCDGGAPPAVPPGGPAFAATAKLGYDWSWFGFRVGANVWQAWNKNTSNTPTLYAFPSLVLRGGRMTGLRGELGLGSYDIPTIMRPVLWAGAVYVPDPGWEIALRGGLPYGLDPSAGGPRVSTSLKLPISDVVQLGAGLALSGGKDSVEPEGQAMAVFHVW